MFDSPVAARAVCRRWVAMCKREATTFSARLYVAGFVAGLDAKVLITRSVRRIARIHTGATNGLISCSLALGTISWKFDTTPTPTHATTA